MVATLAGRGIALAPEAFSGTWSSETRSGVRDTVERVVVHGNEIAIFLKNRTEDVPSDGAEDAESAENPNVLKANLPGPGPRARREIFLPGAGGSPARPVDQALVLALARARSWMAALRAGQYAETTAIAERFGLSDAHVRRLIRLAYLAPDLVEAIVEGRQPRNLTVKRLLESIPLAWQDQRAQFGCTR